MKKFLILTLCVLLALPAFSVAEESKVLHLMTWETYIDDETIAAFEQETGIDVIYTPMEYNEDILFKLNESGGAGFDLVLGSDYMLDILRKAELIQKLDLSALSNYANLDENYLGKFYDEENEYVIPYMSGSPLIVYDPAKVDFEITGYELLSDSLRAVLYGNGTKIVVNYSDKDAVYQNEIVPSCGYIKLPKGE